MRHDEYYPERLEFWFWSRVYVSPLFDTSRLFTQNRSEHRPLRFTIFAWFTPVLSDFHGLVTVAFVAFEFWVIENAKCARYKYGVDLQSYGPAALCML